MKIREYRIEFICSKCGSAVSISDKKVYKDIASVIAKTEDAKMCHVCQERCITFSRLCAVLADRSDIPKTKYDLAYKCEECGMTFKSEYWIINGDVTPFKNPGAAGVTCVKCRGKKLYLTYCKQSSR